MRFLIIDYLDLEFYPDSKDGVALLDSSLERRWQI